MSLTRVCNVSVALLLCCKFFIAIHESLKDTLGCTSVTLANMTCEDVIADGEDEEVLRLLLQSVKVMQ